RNGGSDEIKNLRLVHSECHRQLHSGDGGNKQQIL
ncbi:HNH endonuclease, partial [Actinacidiphila oryziradicis]